MIGQQNIVVMSAMKDEALDSEDVHALGPVYKELLGLNDTNSLEMPRSIAEFKSVKVGSLLYGSQQSQTIRNSFVLENWAGSEGTIASNSGSDDVRPGQVLSFFRHCVKVKAVQPHLPDKRYTFFIARVNWYSLHPQRYSYHWTKKRIYLYSKFGANHLQMPHLLNFAQFCHMT